MYNVPHKVFILNQNTEDLQQEQNDGNNIRNDNINLDFNASEDPKKNQQIYGQEYVDNQSVSTKDERSQSNSIQSQPEVKQKVPANSLDIRAAGHPGVCVLHFAFKLAALLCYFLISGNSVLTFVLTIVLTAFDFWIVKNISGRKLVLLRWQSEVSESGDEKWTYESMEPGVTPNQIDSTFFWFIQFSICVIWLVLSIIHLVTLSFSWIVLTIACFIISTTNFVGYYKCRGVFIEFQNNLKLEHQKKLKSYMATLGMKAIVNNM